jgi:myosin heavy subunit
MAKKIALSIEIDGLSNLTKQVVGLEQELNNLNKELKGADQGSDAYIKLRNQIEFTKNELSKAKKEQKDFIKSAEATKQAEGSYYQLNQQLVDLRKAYKNLSAAERESAKGMDMQNNIAALDKQLKDIDGSIGQFQRNVGNYPKTFALINRSLMRAIPGFEAFSEQLKDGEGNLTSFGKAAIAGFVAFQSAKFIAGAIKRLDEFISKIEETKETVASFSGAYGEDLDRITASTTALAETFNTDAETISQAAESLSGQLGIGFEEALGKLEGALVQGQGNADDYLSTIAEYPEAFKEASGEVTDFSERNKNLLATNKELASSQVEVANKLAGVRDTFKNVGKSVETGIFLVFAKLIDIFKPVGKAFYDLGVTLGGLFNMFNKGGKETSLFTAIIENLTVPFKLIAFLFQTAADGISFLVKGVTDFISQSPLLTSIFEQIGKGIALVQEGFNNLPAVFAGVVSALKQLGTNFVNFFQSLYLDAQIFGQQVAGAFGSNVKDAIAELRKQRDAVNSDGKSLADAFGEGYNDAKKKADEQREKDAKAAAVRIQKIDGEALKNQREQLADNAKKLADERKKYAEDELKQARERAALLADLTVKLQEETIKNIQDNRTRELKEIEQNAKQQVVALQKQYDDLKLAAEEREKELAETFGKTSAELIKTQQENAKLLEDVKKQQAEIEVQIEINKNNQIAKVNETSRIEEIEKQKENLEKMKELRDSMVNSEIEFIDELSAMRELKNEEALNKMLASEKDAKKREGILRVAEEQRILNEIATIKNKIQALDDQEAFLKEQAAKGIEIRQEEFDTIAKSRQELNTQLSSSELQYVDTVKKTTEDIKKLRQSQLEEIAGYAQQGIQLISEALAAADANAEKNIEEQLARSSARQENLNEELENATGLRRRFLQQQIDNEIKNQKKLEQEKEKINKEAAEREKVIAIIQSIINTALAVTKALATGGPIAAVIAGITGAAQTAIIAAQPLAEGGAVTPVALPDSGGKVIGAQNIPQTSRGDNVLVAARVGETFLNAEQTSRLRPVLSAAKIPGFYTGGSIGSPNLSGVNNGMLTAFNDRTAAISGQVMESKVYLVTDELRRDNAEGDRIKKKVTLR